ncbi:MAG TPA: M15 family metallopeptidase [Actinomycetota bacterium]|nr:M15 family metallopeptidase [Actinomycetota bacterium]
MGKLVRSQRGARRLTFVVIVLLLLGAGAGDASLARSRGPRSLTTGRGHRPSEVSPSPTIPPLLYFNVNDQPVVSVSSGPNGVVSVTGVEPSNPPTGLIPFGLPGANPAAATPDRPSSAATAVASALPGFADAAGARALGMLSYTANPGGTISEDQGWVKANIVTETVPLLGPVTCNRQMFPELVGAMEALQADGLSRVIDAAPLPADSCWDPRFQGDDPTRGLSYHAWGLAITLNPDQNVMGGPSHQDPRLVSTLASWGFVWGGTWAPADPADFVLPNLLLPASGSLSVSVAASSTVTAGATVTATAAIEGAIAPTGSVTLQLFGPDDPTCAGPPASLVTAPLVGTGAVGAVAAPEVPGAYSWVARYAGDALNPAASSSCAGASTLVSVAQASLVLGAASAVPLGEPTAATAALSGGAVGSGGTLTFLLYGPDDPTCARDPGFEAALLPPAPGSYSSTPTVPSSPGVYQWVATYSGDDGSPPAGTGCGAAPVTILTP